MPLAVVGGKIYDTTPKTNTAGNLVKSQVLVDNGATLARNATAAQVTATHKEAVTEAKARGLGAKGVALPVVVPITFDDAALFTVYNAEGEPSQAKAVQMPHAVKIGNEKYPAGHWIVDGVNMSDADFKAAQNPPPPPAPEVPDVPEKQPDPPAAPKGKASASKTEDKPAATTKVGDNGDGA